MNGKRMAKQGENAVQNEAADVSWPFVSVICPTYNRKTFLPYLLYIYQSQDYPAERRELIILDDSPQSSQHVVEALVRASRLPNVRYYHHPEHLTLGKKRNMLNALATGEYIVCMDDDDYYAPDKLTYTVREMMAENSSLSGSDQILIWYSHLNKIYMTGSHGPFQAPNGTFAYHRRYLKKHRYDDRRLMTEETEFLNGFTVPIHQLDPHKTILCISHSSNTFDKSFIMGNCTPVDLKLEDIVQDKMLLSHYQRLSQAPVTQRIDWHFFEKIVLIEQNEESKTALLAELDAFGISEDQILIVKASGNPCRKSGELETHIHILEQAQKEKWRNYLLLDSRIRFVKQDSMIVNVNRFIDALRGLSWQVALFGGGYLKLTPLNSLQGAARIHFLHFAASYAVNREYYDCLLENYRNSQVSLGASGDTKRYALDYNWNELSRRDKWLGVYPSMCYLEEIHDEESGETHDVTHHFFRKFINELPTEVVPRKNQRIHQDAS